MNTELYIEDRRLDITTDISTLLNFAIDDIKSFSSRSTTWSRTIILPGTANNNQLFGHIFQVGQANTYNSGQQNVGFNFNAAKSAPCILFQDQIQTFKGVLRLLQVNYYDGLHGRVDYEVSVFGTLVGLNSALSGALLEDLDFSAYDHVYNDANIVASWDNPGGSGYYYPLIDYGTYSTLKHDWDIKTFRPALYVKEYVDKIFTAAGMRYVSDLLDTPRFKKLVVPMNKKVMTISLLTLFEAEITSPLPLTLPVVGVFDPLTGGVLIPFPTHTGTGLTANGANTVFTYNGTIATNIIFPYTFQGTFTPAGFATATLLVWKNGDGTTLVDSQTALNSPFTWTRNLVVSMAPGDTIEFRLIQGASGIVSDFVLNTGTFKATAAGGTGVSVPIAIGDTVTVNENIPKNIRQIDFLIGLVKLFNLYIVEDKNDENLFHITPYIDYYSKNTSNAIDWTHKLNRNKPMKARPMSELNAKIYKFKFKSDSDYFNDLYRKRYNSGYGDRVYDSEFEFTQQTSEFEIIFSSTPLVGYGGEDKVYPTIFKRSGNDAAPTEENVDSNIRILQTKKITGVASWQIKDGATVLNTLTLYGYAGHLDDPATPSNDLNFGAPKELFFILAAGSLSSNQFNVYWSGYMREITDKDSKLVTGNFYLTAKDILNLDFSKYVYVEGIAFRLNAIKDYDASNPNDCIVELFKVNAPSYSEAPGNDGPPLGCYLLWSDEQTLDWDDDEPLQYSSCQDNPGDGGGGGPAANTLSWSFQRIGFLSWGSINIYVDDVLTVSSTAENDSGVFDLVDGQEIRVVVSSYVNRQKRIFVSNSVDGMLYDQTTTGTPTHTHTFTIEADKDYTVYGSINIPLS